MSDARLVKILSAKCDSLEAELAAEREQNNDFAALIREYSAMETPEFLRDLSGERDKLREALEEASDDLDTAINRNSMDMVVGVRNAIDAALDETGGGDE